MIQKTERFNAGFGITLNRPLCRDYVWRDRATANRAKLILSIPIVGVIYSISIMLHQDFKNKTGKSMAVLRGILCGSIVGIPVCLALDIVGMITQVRQRVNERRVREAIALVMSTVDLLDIT